MGTQIYIGTDLRIANDVTFMPGADADKHHVIVTAICNRGKSRSGKDLRDEISLNFWGKRAQNAAFYLYKGKQINIIGRIQSYTEDKGETNAAGKRVLNRKIEVVVTRMELLGDSMKEMEVIVAGNIQILKNAGRLPQEFTVTAAELIKSNKPKAMEFNAAESAVTGKYGRANVWTKDKGMWSATGQPTPTGTPANVDVANMAAELEALKAKVAAAENDKTASVGADGDPEPNDVFPVA